MYFYYPRPILAWGYRHYLHQSVCVCVSTPSLSVPQLPVLSRITKFGPEVPTKTLWLRSLLFLEAIDLDPEGQIQLKNPNLPPFWACHPFKLGSPNLDQRCKTPWLRSLLFWGQLTLTYKVKFNNKKSQNFILPGFTTRLNTQPVEWVHNS